jgi:hypothetical protein
MKLYVLTVENYENKHILGGNYNLQTIEDLKNHYNDLINLIDDQYEITMQDTRDRFADKFKISFWTNMSPEWVEWCKYERVAHTDLDNLFKNELKVIREIFPEYQYNQYWKFYIEDQEVPPILEGLNKKER